MEGYAAAGIASIPLNAGWTCFVTLIGGVRAFAVVVDKHVDSTTDAVAYAFEEICNRFNLFLARLWRNGEGQHRGLIVMDKWHYEEALQRLSRRFRWGSLRLAEVPLFVDSVASRLIQLADLLAWAVWRRYEHNDPRYFDRVIHRFDNEGASDSRFGASEASDGRPAIVRRACPGLVERAVRLYACTRQVHPRPGRCNWAVYHSEIPTALPLERRAVFDASR